MFDIGWSEFIVIGVVALIAIGPKELPTVLRTCGQWMGKIRRMASEFQGQFQEAMREAEMADLKKHVDDIAETASSFSNFDPIGTIRKEVESITGDKLPEAPHKSPPAPPIGAPPAEPEMAAAQGAAHETPHAGETPAAFETTSPVEAPPPAAAAPEPTSPPHAAAASEPAPPSWTPKPGEGA